MKSKKNCFLTILTMMLLLAVVCVGFSLGESVQNKMAIAYATQISPTYTTQNESWQSKAKEYFEDGVRVGLTAESAYNGVTVFDSTKGNTAENPYVIDSLEKFVVWTRYELPMTVLDSVNPSFKNKFVTLSVDVDLGDYYFRWNNGGGHTSSFAGGSFEGSFDGQNHTISNVFVLSAAQTTCGGIFVNVGGNVSNLIIDNAKLLATGSASAVGVLASSCGTQQSVTNVHVKNSYIGCGEQGASSLTFVGGLIGRVLSSQSTNAQTIISNCSVKQSELDGQYYVGGIVGNFAGNGSTGNSILNISSCYSYGNTITASSNAGGIIGSASSIKTDLSSAVLTVEKCYNYSTVSAQNRAGGIVGSFSNGADRPSILNNAYFVVTACGNAGQITAKAYGDNGGGWAGGIVGLCYVAENSSGENIPQISFCYNHGDISAEYGLNSASMSNLSYPNSGYYAPLSAKTSYVVSGITFRVSDTREEGARTVMVYDSYNSGTLTLPQNPSSSAYVGMAVATAGIGSVEDSSAYNGTAMDSYALDSCCDSAIGSRIYPSSTSNEGENLYLSAQELRLLSTDLLPYGSGKFSGDRGGFFPVLYDIPSSQLYMPTLTINRYDGEQAFSSVSCNVGANMLFDLYYDGAENGNDYDFELYTDSVCATEADYCFTKDAEYWLKFYVPITIESSSNLNKYSFDVLQGESFELSDFKNDANLQKTGYEVSGIVGEIPLSVMEPTTYQAKYTPINYTITLLGANGSSNIIQKTYGSTLAAQEIASYAGCGQTLGSEYFLNWYTTGGNSSTNAFAGGSIVVSENLSLSVNSETIAVESISINTSPTKTTYSKNSEIDVTGLTITVSYNHTTAQTPSPINVDSGWVSGFNTAVAGDYQATITYQSKTVAFDYSVLENYAIKLIINPEGYGTSDYSQLGFDAGNYDVNIDGNTLQIGNDRDYYSGAYPKSNDSEYSYSFDGYTLNGHALPSMLNLTEDIDIYVNFSREKISYTISFDTLGGSSNPTSITEKWGSSVDLPTPPTKTGYLFGGWFKSEDDGDTLGNAFDNIVPKSNIVVYAKWSECDHGENENLPTCTQGATCSLCGGSINALGHDYGEWQKHDANQHKRICARDNTHIDYANHTWNNGLITTEPTHTEFGEKTFTCTVCGEMKTEDIAKLTAHTFSEVADAIYLKTGATCTSPAVYYKSCECGVASDETFEYGAALSHSYDTIWHSDINGHWHICSVGGEKGEVTEHSPDRHAPTETEAVKCTECQFVITPATGHIVHTADTSKWLSNGTSHWHTCVGCEEKMDVTAHSGGTATCQNVAVCEVCGEQYSDLGNHNYGAWTSHDGAQHKRECSVCHEYEYANHAWNSGAVTTAPTHSTEGERTFTCADCGATRTESILALAEHVYNQEVATAAYLKSAATCTSRAVYYKSCICGERGTETFEYGELMAHTSEIIPAQVATCTAAGHTSGSKCSVCGTIITATTPIDALGHNYVFAHTVAPNLENQTDGYDLYTCSHDATHIEQRNLVEWETLIPKVTVSVLGGTIQGQSGNSAIVNKDGSVTVIAEAPADGKVFVGWKLGDEIVSNNQSYTFTAIENITLTAIYKDAPRDGLSVGVIAGIAVGGTAVIGFGGFAIFWFVIKKKKFADLLAIFKKK